MRLNYYWRKKHRKMAKKFSEEFKKKVARERITSNKDDEEIAKKYGISPSSVYAWTKFYKDDVDFVKNDDVELGEVKVKKKVLTWINVNGHSGYYNYKYQ
jgi:transposase-like protein